MRLAPVNVGVCGCQYHVLGAMPPDRGAHLFRRADVGIFRSKSLNLFSLPLTRQSSAQKSGSSENGHAHRAASLIELLGVAELRPALILAGHRGLARELPVNLQVRIIPSERPFGFRTVIVRGLVKYVGTL